jgi:hypothetical protein
MILRSRPYPRRDALHPRHRRTEWIRRSHGREPTRARQQLRDALRRVPVARKARSRSELRALSLLDGQRARGDPIRYRGGRNRSGTETRYGASPKAKPRRQSASPHPAPAYDEAPYKGTPPCLPGGDVDLAVAWRPANACPGRDDGQIPWRGPTTSPAAVSYAPPATSNHLQHPHPQATSTHRIFRLHLTSPRIRPGTAHPASSR